VLKVEVQMRGNVPWIILAVAVAALVLEVIR
jgi:hypothetical protein